MKNSKLRFTVMIAFLARGIMALPAAGSVVNVSVIDSAGNPVQGANVRVDSMDNGMTISIVPECLTDKSGRCSCEHLMPGRYAVNAGKENAGYPNVWIRLYRHGEPPKTILITSAILTIEVSLTLGPKAASIEISAIDAATGSQIKNPTIVLRRASQPSDFLSTTPDPNSRILIPADDDILMEVSAQGYRPWLLTDQIGGKPLHLHSDVNKRMAILLERK
jgi:hypothetical protein